LSGHRLIMGVDPGVTGAIAFYSPDDPSLITAEDIPTVAGEVDPDTLAARIKQMRPTECVIERVHSMPKQGVSSTFKFGAAYGMIRGVTATLGIPCQLVSPSTWKKHFHLAGKDKEAARALAIQLWPGVGYFARKLDHNRAEASLLARWGAEAS
jgi:hypothetical protein